MISVAPQGLETIVFSSGSRFRAEWARSQAVVISTPEYAHGVPGTLKNALDWVVRSGERYETPIALINPSARCTHRRHLWRKLSKPWGRTSSPKPV